MRKTCTEHASTASGCARCQTDTRVQAGVARFKEILIANLKAGWPCALPGGEIYGPYEDALWMIANSLECGSPPLDEMRVAPEEEPRTNAARSKT